MTVEEPVNYRTVGRRKGALAPRRPPKSGWRCAASSGSGSIPAKFETLLYDGTQEEKGFGSRAPRFGQDQREFEAPGPGAYTSDAVATGTSEVAAAAPRGKGPFASRSRRLEFIKDVGPGPGAYSNAAGTALPPAALPDAPSAAFVAPRSANPAKFHSRPSPGPGAYDDVGAERLGHRVRLRAPPFMSSARLRGDRMEYSMQRDQPGPGEYEGPHTARASSEPQRSRHARAGGSSSSQRPAGRNETAAFRAGAELIATETSAPLPQQEGNLLGAPRASQARAVSSGPGPGEYEPRGSARGGYEAGGGSFGETSSFRLGLSHLPRSWRQVAPGPGQYEVPRAFSEADSGAVPAVPTLASANPRFDRVASGAPGPAFYSPRKPMSASFHLNAKGTWM